MLFANYASRLRDAGRSPWFLILLIVPGPNLLLMLYMFFAPSAKTKKKVSQNDSKKFSTLNFLLILFAIPLGVAGGVYAWQKYIDYKTNKERECLGFEIPKLEKSIKSFQESIAPNQKLEDVVDLLFKDDEYLKDIAFYGIEKMVTQNLRISPSGKTISDSEFNEIKSLYENRYSNSLQFSKDNIKERVIALEVKGSCGSDFNFLININEFENRDLRSFRVWANNAPAGYSDGFKDEFYRDFANDRDNIRKIEEYEKNEKLRKKYEKKLEKERKERELREHKAREKREHREREAKRKREQEIRENKSYSLGGKYNPISSYSINQYCKELKLYLDNDDDYYCKAFDGKRIYIRGISSSSSSSSPSKGGYDPKSEKKGSGGSVIHEF